MNDQRARATVEANIYIKGQERRNKAMYLMQKFQNDKYCMSPKIQANLNKSIISGL